ncbi:MAG: hypothetical protein ACXVCP_10525 [Bdellovibrio sp.]
MKSILFVIVYSLISLNVLAKVTDPDEYNRQERPKAATSAKELYENIIASKTNDEINKQIVFLESEGYKIYEISRFVEGGNSECWYSTFQGRYYCYFKFVLQTTFMKDNYLFQYIKANIIWSHCISSEHGGCDENLSNKPIFDSVVPFQYLDQVKVPIGEYKYTNKYSLKNSYQSFLFHHRNCGSISCLTQEEKGFADKLIKSGFICGKEYHDALHCEKEIDPNDFRFIQIIKKYSIEKVVFGKPKCEYFPRFTKPRREASNVYQYVDVRESGYPYNLLRNIFHNSEPNLATLHYIFLENNPIKIVLDVYDPYEWRRGYTDIQYNEPNLIVYSRYIGFRNDETFWEANQEFGEHSYEFEVSYTLTRDSE